MLEFIQNINQIYSISATTIKPFHSVWKVLTPGQTFILKRIKTDPVHFSKIAQIINELYQLGFRQLAPIRPTQTGDLYISLGNHFFSLSPYYTGEKTSFQNLQHVKRIGQFFGRIHAFSQKISFPEALTNKQGIDEYQTYHNFLDNLLPGLPLRNEINRIDRTVMEWSDYFLQQSRAVIQELNQYSAMKLFLDKQKGFCHNDPAPGNILMDHGQCILIDFEFVNCDLWLKELTHLALRVLQATEWNPKEPVLDVLISAYHQERPLVDVELQMLPILLRFPRRFWRFCLQRYHEKLPWSEKHYQSRIWEIISEESKRNHFFENWNSKFSF